MSGYKEYYKTEISVNAKQSQQLLQLLRITHDGDLIDKSARDNLFAIGYSAKAAGFNIITRDGIKALAEMGLIHV